MTVLLKMKPEEFEPLTFLGQLSNLCKTQALKDNIDKLTAHMKDTQGKDVDEMAMKSIVKRSCF